MCTVAARGSAKQPWQLPLQLQKRPALPLRYLLTCGPYMEREQHHRACISVDMKPGAPAQGQTHVVLLFPPTTSSATDARHGPPPSQAALFWRCDSAISSTGIHLEPDQAAATGTRSGAAGMLAEASSRVCCFTRTSNACAADAGVSQMATPANVGVSQMATPAQPPARAAVHATTSDTARSRTQLQLIMTA